MRYAGVRAPWSVSSSLLGSVLMCFTSVGFSPDGQGTMMPCSNIIRTSFWAVFGSSIRTYGQCATGSWRLKAGPNSRQGKRVAKSMEVPPADFCF
ncbi:hypothetical protein BJ138DRAFT_692255 [Hygrophoropsis aurantiaca]|uniref:Uncharacterized protein n=1 Tax=Hygrophoropsis aurantiaca TaxID=72124 RepID=A0ACB8ARF4_9AGAM|nr:hypothetical protein BJ138DRAFT_692255 [Hygrophoropsis aurantiaca]